MKLPKRRTLTALLLAACILSSGLIAGCSLFKKTPPSARSSKKTAKSVSEAKPVTIPDQVLGNKFGFLIGAPEEAQEAKKRGARWLRPHPGPFLWDSMQKGKDEEINFDDTDHLVSGLGEQDIGALATLWPFADWDQKSKPDSEKYKVSKNDEFLPKPGQGGGGYLPLYRSNPGDWDAYEKWLLAVVERYDGDGKSDMPGLQIPVKYWEVMNEPDLTSPEPEPRLDFYTEDANAYAELLIRSFAIIKKADPDAKVLIAGAAGGNDQFLDFYRQVLQNDEARGAFDIGNVHCISNDAFDSFNVAPYQGMLQEFGIDKPVWVTEAEAMVSGDASINATQVYQSTKNALGLGAEKIFFTRFGFEGEGGMPPPKDSKTPRVSKAEIDGSDPVKAYQTITGLK